jgi:hypothetical protein
MLWRVATIGNGRRFANDRETPMSQLKQKTIYTYGRSTPVSVDPVLVSVAIKALGDTSTVGQLIQEASSRYDKAKENCGRSRFVQRQLMLSIQKVRI